MTEIGVTRGRGKGGATTTTALILPLLLLLLPLCPRRKLRRSTEAAISDAWQNLPGHKAYRRTRN